jgi:acyl-CoA synthetase (AMP-forming)/AMP-acid ligase II
MPTLDELLDDEPVKLYPFVQSWSEVAQKPFLTLHTSGSTGLPKPIDVTYGLIAAVDAQCMLPDIEGRSVTVKEWAGRTVYTALPPFHAAGINFFIYSVFQSTELIFGPSDQPPSVATVERMLDAKIASAGVMAPSLLAEVAAEAKTLQ